MQKTTRRSLLFISSLSIIPLCLSSGQRVIGTHPPQADKKPSINRPSPKIITLIPQTNENNQWSWNGTVRSSPKPLAYSLVDGNLFGLKSSSGSTDISTQGNLHASIHLDQMSKQGFIIGYPEIIYGYKPFGPLLSKQTPQLQFPLKLAVVPQLWSIADYSVDTSKDPALAVDFAYDLWLTKDPSPTAIHKGDIELMIWTYHRNLKPAGALIKDSRVEIPTLINGSVKNIHWIAYLSNVDSPTRTSILVSFVPDEDGNGSAENGGFSKASVGVNVTEILKQMVCLVTKNVGWSSSYVESLSINDIELGAEFGSKDNHAVFDWEVLNYRYVLGLPNAAVVE
jgi:hypothetical protein